MSSPACKRQKLADDLNSVAEMSTMKVSPTKDSETQTDNVTITASASNKPFDIDVKGQTFTLVANSDGFVDRTMLIKELPKRRQNYVMIFAPSKFGKTINLSMIRLFFDIEDKFTKTKEDIAKEPTMQELRSNPSKNMKIFLRQFEDKHYEECEILKEEEFVIQHFGRHPVILFNFKNFNTKTDSDAVFACALEVKKAYLENRYLKTSKEFQSNDDLYRDLKTTCETWCSYDKKQLETLSEIKVTDGFLDLIKSLRIHWGRDPVFLVDEFDRPCISAMESGISKDQIFNIGKTFTNVICSILKAPEDELNLLAALVTGICKLKNAGHSSMDNTMKIYFLSDSRFSKYYGLTAQEVESLVRRFYGSQGDDAIKKIITDINAYYNGYYQRSSSGENEQYARYCLFSVLNYLSQLEEDKNKVNFYFWNDSGYSIGRLAPILKKNKSIMSAVHKLLCDDSGSIEITYQSKINIENIYGLYGEDKKVDPDTIFNLFLQQGYLAHSLKEPNKLNVKKVKIHVRIPNLEIKNMWDEMFMSYHRESDVLSTFVSCGKIFEKLPTQNSIKVQESLKNLCKDLECIFRSMKCENEATICCHILSTLKVYANYDKGDMEYIVQYKDDKNKSCHSRIDIWGRHQKFAVIFEVKYNPKASSEPGKIGEKAYSSLAAAEDIVELLPGKEKPENRSSTKAGTGNDIKVLKSHQIDHYLLVGLAVDGDYTTHMLAFHNTHDWNSVIQVNPENHVTELISKYLKSK